MIVYLHGFSSGAASHKANVLKRALAPITVLVPEYPSHKPVEAITLLQKIIVLLPLEKGEPLVIAGSSLGGFYAQYLAYTQAVIDGLIMINPALEPKRTLLPYVGEQVNMVTGKPFILEETDLDKMQAFDVNRVTEKPSLILLDEADEVIDSRVAQQRYTDTAQVVMYPDGSHRFEHLNEAISEIKHFYADLERQKSHSD